MVELAPQCKARFLGSPQTSLILNMSCRANVFATRACIVYASARSLDSMTDLTHPNVKKLVVDVTSDLSIQEGVDEIYSEAGRIDFLISNAGMPAFGM